MITNQAIPAPINSIYTIYLITNTINGLVYIGRTINTIKVRFRNHCAKSSKCPALREAISVFGKGSFSIEALICATSRSQARWLENHFIDKLNSTDPTIGYNRSGGGSGCWEWSEQSKTKLSKTLKGKTYPGRRKLSPKQELEVIQLYLSGALFIDIAEEFDCAMAVISKIIKRHNLPRRKFGRVSNELEQNIIKAYSENKSYDEITNQFSIGVSTIIKIVMKNDLPRQTASYSEYMKNKIVTNKTAIIQDYLDEVLYQDIAAKYGIPENLITDLVKNNNLPKRDHTFKQMKLGNGIVHHNAQLTETQVIDIKELMVNTDLTNAQIGKRYDVKRAIIARIRIGKTWKHIPFTNGADNMRTDKKSGQKLIRADVIAIKQLIDQNVDIKQIAKSFNVTPENIRHIKIGNTWKDV